MFAFLLLGGVLEFTETTDGGANSGGVGGGEGVSTTSLSLVATSATPDTDGTTTEAELTAEGAEVASLGGDFELLSALTGVSTIAGTVAAHNAHLLSTLRHSVLEEGVCLKFLFRGEKNETIERFL